MLKKRVQKYEEKKNECWKKIYAKKRSEIFYAPESTLQYNLRSCSLISWEALKFNDLYYENRWGKAGWQMNLCNVSAALHALRG